MVGERDDAMSGVLGKALVALVAIAAAIALGTFVMVRALGLDDGSAASPPVSDATSVDPLPTTALPVPGEEAETEQPEEETEEPEEPEETQPAEGDLQLEVSPQQVGPSERINLTGRYQGGDNLTLQVQRFEGGSWADFPVTASVSNGTFQTWIQTSRTGEQRLRVYDAQGDSASNEVSVQVG